MFTEYDSYLFHQGTMYDAYKKLGAHFCTENGQEGVRFAVWAERARAVSVAIFDGYTGEKDLPMEKTEHGIWELFVPGIVQGTCYKYLIDGADGVRRYKADPFAFYSELRPANGSVVWGMHDYPWTDEEYMKELRPAMHAYESKVPAPDKIPAEWEAEIQDILTREVESTYKKELDDAKWFASEKIDAERKAEEAKEALRKAEANVRELEEDQKKEDVLQKKHQESGKDTLTDKEKADAVWAKKLEKAIAAAQKKVVKQKPRVFEKLTDEEKLALVNRAAAERTREKPMSIYEVHLGSWKKDYRLNKEGFLNYRQLADELADYVNYLGFTHVEVMGICEYPFDGSWGYQVTGYFSPTSRHGTPEDLKYFIDKMHSRGIGVILDWVPAHFPKDAFGLVYYDGSPMFESEDHLLAEYPEWGTMAFDHAKPEVRSFLISSAFYWIREFHADALRVDAVAAMIYTNFSRAEWRPNKYGGSLNLDSIAFMKQLNKEVVERTGSFLIAEDSSAEQGITRQVYEGGMGFMYKWNMGWMNDTLFYFKKDPVYRKYHFDQLTHTTDYVYSEFFVNVLSHDEVVHLKKPMLYKMPGPIPDKLMGLKTLYTYQFTHPGKKLLFMGQEFAEDREWDENRDIKWEYASETWHRDVLLSVQKLLHIYKEYEVLFKDTRDERTLEWVNRKDAERGIMAYIRKKPDNYDGALLVILNTTPVQYSGYSCGVPKDSYCKRIFSTYDTTPGTGETSDQVPPMIPVKDACDGYDYRLSYDLRPNEAVIIELR